MLGYILNNEFSTKSYFFIIIIFKPLCELPIWTVDLTNPALDFHLNKLQSSKTGLFMDNVMTMFIIHVCLWYVAYDTSRLDETIVILCKEGAKLIFIRNLTTDALSLGSTKSLRPTLFLYVYTDITYVTEFIEAF